MLSATIWFLITRLQLNVNLIRVHLQEYYLSVVFASVLN